MKFNRQENKRTGSEGEDEAERHLVSLGYKILGRNVTLSFGEIDILVRDGRSIVVVEVKTVRGSGFGLAQELVRFKKQRKLKLLGRAIEQRYPNHPVRIDVIGIHYDANGPQLEHIKNAVS